jgi:hypothetical protein
MRPSEFRGKEIFEIHPIILGGDPVDPKNKTVLDREQHIQAVTYWNRLIAEQRAQRRRPSPLPEAKRS